jgi:Ca-activated chloride channel family protein
MRTKFPLRLGWLLSTAFLLVVGPSLAWADGLIVIHQPPPNSAPPGHFSFAPLEVSYHRVSVEVNDLVATTSVDQEFYNPNSARLEGTYLFPLPDGAHIDRFSMDVNGRETPAELLDADRAKSIYETIVRQSRDPALLEYVGKGAFRARVFPIEPNSRKRIKIAYTQLLKSDGGLIEYTYPLNTEKFSAKPLGDVSVKVTVACAEPLKSVYSPSHNVEIRRDGDRKATAGFEQRNVRPDTDFKLIFSRSKAEVGVDLLTYRNAPDDGYFLLMASPGFGASASTKVQQRDVCFVIDTSGSMAENGGKKMEQAKKALSFCLANLNEGDRFEVVRFSTEAEGLFSGLQPATKENVEKAQSFVSGLKPIGGTAIQDALQKALALRGSGADRPYVIIFLTDGQPTVGETNEDKLVESVAKANSDNTRIFSFGIGTDINTHLLDGIADKTKAFSQYVLPEENIEVKVSGFYTKIKEPVLTNVEVAFQGGDVKTTQVYPSALPDLYKGEMLIAFGRYAGKGGAAAVKVSGVLNGERREFVTDVRFTEHDLKNGFVPRLWATRRVGWLLDEIRLRGESKELKDEVTRLAREHGIVTPYTAYLIMEDERRRDVPIAMQNLRELSTDALAGGVARDRYRWAAGEAEDRGRRSGAGAVASAKDIQDLKLNDNEEQARQQGERLAKTYALAPGAAAATGPVAAAQPAEGYKKAQNYGQQARVVNSRAFYQNDGVWTDSTAQARKDLKRKEIAFNTDPYFALLKANPTAAPWLALGEQVDLVLGDTLYVIR